MRSAPPTALVVTGAEYWGLFFFAAAGFVAVMMARPSTLVDVWFCQCIISAI